MTDHFSIFHFTEEITEEEGVDEEVTLEEVVELEVIEDSLNGLELWQFCFDILNQTVLKYPSFRSVRARLNY